MQISIITLFPEIFPPILNYSLLKRALLGKKLKVNLINLRDFGYGKHKIVDDKPYGGGAGMVLRFDVLEKAIIDSKKGVKKEAVVLLDPKGTTYTQSKAELFSSFNHLILVCGHYEGFDDRVRSLVDYDISIGDYILSGGEIASMAIIESLARLIPGVLKKEDAAKNESFSKTLGARLLEEPQFTRPEVYKKKRVPKILLSGNAKLIQEYRKKEALKLTKLRRPDILKKKS